MPEFGDGNKVFIYVRQLGSAEAYKILFQREHENNPTRDRETTATKDGTGSSGAALEDELSVTAIRPKDFDTHKFLKLAVRDGIKYEVWVVYLEDSKVVQQDDGSGTIVDKTKYYSEYRQGYITEYGGTDGTEDAPEVELTYIPDGGVYQPGYTVVPEGDEALIGYVFHEMDGTVAKNATAEDEALASKTIDDYVAGSSSEESTPTA